MTLFTETLAEVFPSMVQRVQMGNTKMSHGRPSCNRYKIPPLGLQTKIKGYGISELSQSLRK